VNRILGLFAVGAVLFVTGCSSDSPDRTKPRPAVSGPAVRTTENAAHSYAACMRAHGVEGFPDPDPYGGYVIGRHSGIDPDSATYQAAYTACQALV